MVVPFRASRCWFESTAQCNAVGFDDLDDAGKVVDRDAVEETPFVGQADVGKQVAVALRFGGERAGDVLTGHQAGDARVAAEEVVAHRDHPYVVTSERLDERRDDGRTQFAGEHADRSRSTGPQRDRRGTCRSPPTCTLDALPDVLRNPV